jgi:hypothetical protein
MLLSIHGTKLYKTFGQVLMFQLQGLYSVELDGKVYC